MQTQDPRAPRARATRRHEPTTPEPEVVMDMLAERFPLSLIMDLTMPAGPHSDEILAEEGEPEQAWWEPR